MKVTHGEFMLAQSFLSATCTVLGQETDFSLTILVGSFQYSHLSLKCNQPDTMTGSNMTSDISRLLSLRGLETRKVPFRTTNERRTDIKRRLKLSSLAISALQLHDQCALIS